MADMRTACVADDLLVLTSVQRAAGQIYIYYNRAGLLFGRLVLQCVHSPVSCCVRLFEASNCNVLGGDARLTDARR